MHNEQDLVKAMVTGLLYLCVEYRTVAYKEISEFVQRKVVDNIEAFKIVGQTNNFITLLNKCYAQFE
jgi:hypothetical protein